MFYPKVKATVQHVGITTAFGRCNTGKSMASDEPPVMKATTGESNNVEEELRQRLNDLSMDESQLRIEDLKTASS